LYIFTPFLSAVHNQERLILQTIYVQNYIYQQIRRHIHNMKNQFWAGLGNRAVLVKKKFGADYEQLLRPVFLCFQGQKINLRFF
jgi:hypothetical protein